MSTWSDLKDNPRLKSIYDTRINILRLIREFFWSQDFLETDTPAVVRLAGQEPYLNPISIVIHDTNNTMHRMYLRTSPEYALKKLLAAGYAKIFELGKCWRDGESFGGSHNPEFTMLEWYRFPGTYQNIMDDTENLFKFVGEKLSNPTLYPSPYRGGNANEAASVSPSPIRGGTEARLLTPERSDGGRGGVLRYKDKKINIFEKWDRLSMKEIWQKYLQANLDDYLNTEQIKNLAEDKGYKIEEDEEYENIFYKIFLNEIEPKLGVEKPVFIYDYPACMASLSRLCPHDNRYAERFELYIGGLELANAFGELTNADEQKERLEKDKELRQKLGKETWPVDEDFIKSLDELDGLLKKEGGLAGHSSAGATAGGIALGVDRMVLLFTGAKDLNEVMFQSVSDQIDSD